MIAENKPIILREYRQTQHAILRRSGKNFTVEILGWSNVTVPSGIEVDFPFKWNVYVYLHHDHPLFEGENESLEICGDTEIPFNGAVTLKERRTNSRGDLLLVGCDYQHEWNYGCNTEEIPSCVALDAATIFNFLEEMEHLK